MFVTKITFRILVVVLLISVVGIASVVRGIEPGITFATQGIDLKIDSKAWYNGYLVKSATWKLKNLVPGADKFFNFDDIKPGDYGCNVISMHVKSKDAWMCLDFKNLEESENGVNEPESHEDATPGADLADGMEFFGWIDDGDGKFEPPFEKPIFGTSTQSASEVLNDKTYVIGDSKWGGICKKDTTRYVGTCWCAGDLIVNLQTGKIECDHSTLGNEAQTDSFSVDVEIRAEPAKDKPKFICGNTPPKDDEHGNNGVGNGEDPPPPGGGNSGNDGPGTGPGNPGGSGTAPGGGSGGSGGSGGGTTAPGQCGRFVPQSVCDLINNVRNR
jgi:uncharacterized membrane protein YgcG